MKNLIYIAFLAIIISCQSNNASKLDVFIFYENPDTIQTEYYQFIMSLPDYQSWEYNSRIIDKNNVKDYSFFEGRKLIIDGIEYYHFELFKQKQSKLSESSIYQKEVVCYFRVALNEGKIKILDRKAEKFIDLQSEEGLSYFRNCLMN